MSIELEAGPIKGHVCGNCGALDKATGFHLPENWVEVRVRSGAGIHTDTAVCGDCRDAFNQALAERRNVPAEAKKPAAKRRAATEKTADAAPVSEVAPADVAPVEEKSGTTGPNATAAAK